jgi:DNA-binding FadR family transcriptional regulator
VSALAYAGDRRALFERIIDDVRRRIAEGIMCPGDQLDSARGMAGYYNVSVMTAQRALRELQIQRITFAVRGVGTFVHPEALVVLHGVAGRLAPEDPLHYSEILGYLAHERGLFDRYVTSHTPGGREAALRALLAHIGQNRDVIDVVLGHDALPPARSRTQAPGRAPWWRRS